MTKGLACILAVALLTSPLPAQPAQEYAVKAAVLYNITKFVEWPPEAFKSRSDPVNVCVLGENPFVDALAEALGGKLHDNRSFAVRYLHDSSAASACQVLFVSASEQNISAPSWRKLRPVQRLRSETLTVSPPPVGS